MQFLSCISHVLMATCGQWLPCWATQKQDSSPFTEHVLGSAALARPDGPGPHLCFLNYTQNMLEAAELREITQYALLLCAQNNNLKQVTHSSTRIADKIHQEYP